MDWFIELNRQIDWKDFNAVISAFAFLITAFAALLAALRAGTILEALREFRKSKSDVNNLLEAIDRLESVTPKLKLAASDLEEDISDLKRPAPVPPEQESASTAVAGREAGAVVPMDDSNWEGIRKIWRGVRDTIESNIDELDGRRRRPYNRVSRYNYDTLIQMLFDDGELKKEQADAAMQMNKRFLELRITKDKSSIGEEEVQKFKGWKAAFDQETADG